MGLIDSPPLCTCAINAVVLSCSNSHWLALWCMSRTVVETGITWLGKVESLRSSASQKSLRTYKVQRGTATCSLGAQRRVGIGWANLPQARWSSLFLHSFLKGISFCFIARLGSGCHTMCSCP